MNMTQVITLTVFGRYTFGKKLGQVNPKSSASVVIYTAKRKDTGQEESVHERINRFMEESDTPTYKIADIHPLGWSAVRPEPLAA